MEFYKLIKNDLNLDIPTEYSQEFYVMLRSLLQQIGKKIKDKFKKLK